jgi:SAM-dependent methyltransferase
MGCSHLCSWLTGRSRGEIQDRELRMVHAAGPTEAFLRIRDRLYGRVLEVGCGTGILFEHYPAGTQVLGIDSDTDFLPLARERAVQARANVEVVAGDIRQLCLPDAAFDAAVMNLVLCSVADPARGMAEILRVVRPGGLLYFYEHVISGNVLYRWFQNVTAPLVVWMGDGCHWNRDTGALVRTMPVKIESEETGTLRTGLLPPLPIVRIVGRNR